MQFSKLQYSEESQDAGFLTYTLFCMAPGNKWSYYFKCRGMTLTGVFKILYNLELTGASPSTIMPMLDDS